MTEKNCTFVIAALALVAACPRVATREGRPPNSNRRRKFRNKQLCLPRRPLLLYPHPHLLPRPCSQRRRLPIQRWPPRRVICRD